MARGRERGADDAGEIAELGDAHLAAGVELVDELLGVLHDAAADHDQLRPQHRVQLREVRVEPLGPLLPREMLLGALRVGGPRVGDLAVHLEVAELGVGDEHAVVQQRGADAGADGHEQHDAAPVARRAEARLGEPGRVGVVQHGARPAGRPPDHRGRVRADPRSSMCAAVRTVPPTTTAGSVQPIGPSPPSCSTSVATVADTASGVAGLRCLEPDPAGRGAGAEVDVRGLDARAADVDTDERLRRRHRVRSYSRAGARRAT